MLHFLCFTVLFFYFNGIDSIIYLSCIDISTFYSRSVTTLCSIEIIWKIFCFFLCNHSSRIDSITPQYLVLTILQFIAYFWISVYITVWGTQSTTHLNLLRCVCRWSHMMSLTLNRASFFARHFWFTNLSDPSGRDLPT